MLVLAALCTTFARGQGEILVIKGGTLVDVVNGRPVANAAVVIEGNLIKEVITGPSKPLPAGRVIDASGKSILPGLIDSHVHYRDFSPPLFLATGVTTVFDFGNPGEWIRAQARAHENGTIRGPRIFFVGNMIQAPRREGQGYSPGELDEGYYRLVTSPEQMSGAVNEQKQLGASAIKLHQRNSPELMTALIAAARAAGLPVMAHLGSVDVRAAAAAGLRLVVHTGGLELALVRDPARLAQLKTGTVQRPQALWEPQYFAETIHAMVAHDVFLNPTLENNWGMVAPLREKHRAFETAFLNRPEIAGFMPAEDRNRFLTWFDRYKNDPAAADEAARSYANVRSFVKQFVAAGGRLVAGSDSIALPMGTGLRRELALLVEAGLTPMQTIQAATINSAALFHLDQRLGSVAPGRLADIVIVDGGPESITEVGTRIAAVIKDGKLMETGLDAGFVNPIPRRGFLKPVTAHQQAN
jgi:imidazolonepropionase-like amidohydrolase